MPTNIAKPNLTRTVACHAVLLLALGCPVLAAAPDSAASGEFLVTKHGAVADDATLDSAAIQQAIAACASAGGGTVRVPKGRFLVGGCG